MVQQDIPLEPPFVRWASWYDALYASRGRNPDDEVAAIRPMVESIGVEPRHLRILDVGCGTGVHWQALSKLGKVTGIDRCAEMLAVARQLAPEGDWRLGDVQTMTGTERFHAVVMLFGVCGYARTECAAQALLRHAAARLEPGGLLIVGVEFVGETLKPAEARVTKVERDGVLITRSSTAEIRRAAEGSRQLVTTFTFCDGDSNPMWREEHHHLIASREAWQDWLAQAVAPVHGSWSLLVGPAAVVS